jgi:putative ABC transport system ATP-binding protein
MTTDQHPQAAASPPLVLLEDIHKVYNSGENAVHAVRGVSLTINPGEFVAFMGASGSGKSTLMNILGCLDKPTKGRYLLDGIDIATCNRDKLAHLRNEKLGFIFQNFNLLARTSALENVELPMLYSTHRRPRKERRKLATEALERVGLGSRLDHTPAELSGGQQQRVAIARALANNPRFILADEPTGNLDSRTTVEIMALFQELNRDGITILMVTHEPEIAAFCSRRIVLRDGTLRSDTRFSKPADAKLALEKLGDDHSRIEAPVQEPENAAS